MPLGKFCDLNMTFIRVQSIIVSRCTAAIKDVPRLQTSWLQQKLYNSAHKSHLVLLLCAEL